jgi:hypothetical protein
MRKKPKKEKIPPKWQRVTKTKLTLSNRKDYWKPFNQAESPRKSTI